MIIIPLAKEIRRRKKLPLNWKWTTSANDTLMDHIIRRNMDVPDGIVGTGDPPDWEALQVNLFTPKERQQRNIFSARAAWPGLTLVSVFQTTNKKIDVSPPLNPTLSPLFF